MGFDKRHYFTYNMVEITMVISLDFPKFIRTKFGSKKFFKKLFKKTTKTA